MPLETEEQRAERILRELNRIPRRPPSRHGYNWFVLISTLVLLAGIAFVILRNKDRFATFYQHMTSPSAPVDSAPAGE